MWVKRNKYGNKRCEYNGMKFDSQAELRHWKNLELLEKAGKIRGLSRQIPFLFEYGGNKIGKYVADYCYFENDQPVVSDCKGKLTDLYKWKKKMMKAFFGIIILEVK